MIWSMIFITILIFIAAVFVIQFSYIIFGGYAPYIQTRKKIIRRIIDEISFKDGGVVYELGCGNAGFLRAVEKKFPGIKKLIGIECFFFPYLVGSIQTSLQRSKIKIFKKNFFNVNLGEADVIYCFLNSKAMRDLKKKFEKECKSGTQIISYQFSLPGLIPERVIDVYDNKKHKVYFYKI
jgi:hypothetical protein